MKSCGFGTNPCNSKGLGSAADKPRSGFAISCSALLDADHAVPILR